jgi:hypothetical protein
MVEAQTQAAGSGFRLEGAVMETNEPKAIIATNRLRFFVSGDTRTLQQLWRGIDSAGNPWQEWRDVPDETDGPT